MKNTIYFGRQHIFRWLLLCWLLVPWGLQAQTLTHITWNSQVGCQEFRGEKGEDSNIIGSAMIKPGDCVRVCAGSTVRYKVNGGGISNIQWSASGGSAVVVPGTGNTEADITWGSPGGGAVQAIITFTNGNTETQNICIEKINTPIAEFKLINLEKTACKNTEIHFDNVSQQNGGADIINYFWEFGDGTTSTAFEPSHTYSSAGPKYIKLTVTNKCGCSDTFDREIEILEAPPVQINCASVVCEGSVEKYSVQDGCNKGDWKVIGGSLIGQNGNEIEVKWDQVDPADGFGYVMYRSKCACPEWTTVKIPVILKKGEIKGESVVCANTQYKYSLPQWPTTKIDWNVTGPGNGQLTFNQQRNEILFIGTQPGVYTLTAKYFNTLLLCGGEAVKTITVEEPVVISGGLAEICKGTTQSFTATPSVPVVWTVTLNGVTVPVPQPGGTAPFTYDFPVAGSYVITATKQGGGCESKPIFVKVIETPNAPSGSIIGDRTICPGRPYVYTLSTVDPGMVPVWSVTNGTIQGSNAGASVTVIFTAGATSYDVSVRNRTLGTAGCLSTNAVGLKIKAVDLKAISIRPNPGPFCPSSTQTFIANLNGIIPDFMEWSFDSPNFGSFASGQGTSVITVNLNEIAGSVNPTYLNLKIVKCGQTREIKLLVTKLTLPVVNFTNVGKVCLGSDLTFTVDQGTITSATDVTFTFANNSTHVIPTFNPSGTYTFPNNGYIQNNTGADVSQLVTVSYSGTNGCSYKPTATANFIILPETKITISPVYNIAVCDPNTFSYTLTANSSTGLTNIVEWQWQHDGVDIPGANTNSFVISGGPIFGTYKVRAKDINGCVVYSQNVNVIQSCGTGTGCTAPPKVGFIPVWTSCNTIKVNNLSVNNPPDEIQWGSDSILTLVSAQGANSAEFNTNLAGVHVVTVRLRYGSCWYTFNREVKKNYEPKFNISQVCNGNGYNVTLYNSSTIFDINSSAIQYSFNGTGLPVQNGQTVTYNNLSPGTYTFTMTMSAPGLGIPPCVVTQTVTLKPIPNAEFLAPAWMCVGEVNTFSPIVYDPANTYTWFFDGTSYIAPGPDAHITFNSAGPKTIRLEVTTPQNCHYSSGDKNISALGADFGGNLTPLNFTGCEGSAPSIVHTPTLGFPSSYIWMSGSTAVAGAPNTMSFTPTQSGSYWPVLVSAQGCKDYSMSRTPAIVTLKTAPFVSISGKSNICAGSSVTLNGIVTDNTLQYQWSIGSTILVPWTSNPYPITYTTPGLSAGTYNYTLQVRYPGTAGCTASKTFTVTVSNPPVQPTVAYTKEDCQPYSIRLTASGPAAGDYNWSNGMNGQSILVNEGGVYEVIYTAPSGCKVFGQVAVPLSIESLMWVFPTGCYDECRSKDRYILGPKGVFDSHQWQFFGNPIQSGINDVIHPLYFGASGTYNLQIGHIGCLFTSGPMNYFPGKECGIETECRLDAEIVSFKWDGDHYNVHGSIFNGGFQAVTLTVSSLNGYGTYLPSMITIPAGGTYDMNANPLAFYPNASFPGGTDDILFMGQEDCKFVAQVPVIGRPAVVKTERNVGITSSLKMMPNPAKEKVKISYNTGNEKMLAKQITVFDAMGNIKFRKELKASSGEVDVDVSSWMQSVYIVIVQTGDTSLQGKLIKN